jgi:hypothetical protein
MATNLFVFDHAQCTKFVPKKLKNLIHMQPLEFPLLVITVLIYYNWNVDIDTLKIFLQENFMFQSNNGHNSEANTQKHEGMDAPEGSQTK